MYDESIEEPFLSLSYPVTSNERTKTDIHVYSESESLGDGRKCSKYFQLKTKTFCNPNLTHPTKVNLPTPYGVQGQDGTLLTHVGGGNVAKHAGIE